VQARRTKMRLLIIILTTTYSFGQTGQVTIKDLKARDINGQYTIVWTADKLEFTGENLKLKKRSRFEYLVFNNNERNGWDLVERKITSGKYSLNGDTLALEVKHGPKTYEPEFLSFRLKYVIKSLTITTDIDDLEKKYAQLIFPIPADKVDSWEKKRTELQKCLQETTDNQIDMVRYPLRLKRLSTQTEKMFWTENIFTSEVQL
jgi:hypothetical protein